MWGVVQMCKNNPITYRQFRKWCNDRACDGFWSKDVAEACISILELMQTVPWHRRRKVWNRFSLTVMENIVGPINRKIEEFRKEMIEEEMRYGF